MTASNTASATATETDCTAEKKHVSVKKRIRKIVSRLLRAGPENCLVFLGCWLIPKMSRQGVVRLAEILSAILYPFTVSSRRIINANLDIVYGRTTDAAMRKKLVKDILANSLRVILDCLWFDVDGTAKLKKYVSCDDNVLQMLSENNGEFVITGHIGSWELLAQRIVLSGRTVTSVFAPIGNSYTQRRMSMMRREHGQNIVPKNGAAMAMLRALREKHFVGLLLDQRTPTTKGGVFVDFLGLKTTISNVVGAMSSRRKIPVNVLWCRYIGDGYYRCEMIAGIPGDHGMSDIEVSQWIADRLGELIKANPEQWLWMYKRWRHYLSEEDLSKYPFYAGPYNPLVD